MVTNMVEILMYAGILKKCFIYFKKTLLLNFNN